MSNQGSVVTLPMPTEVDMENLRKVSEAVKKAMNDPAPGTPMWYEQKIHALEKKLEAYQLMASYAQDVVDYWPSMTMRTIRVMIPKMDALKEALNLVK